MTTDTAAVLIADLNSWHHAGFCEAGKLLEWVETGLTSAEAAKWAHQRYGAGTHPYWTAAGALEWLRYGFTAADAAVWYEASNISEAAAWRDAGYSPADALSVRDAHRVQSATELAKWAPTGFPLDYILACVRAGVRVEDAGLERWFVPRSTLEALAALRAAA